MKIALVGSAPSSRLLAPYADPSWEIWACSPDNGGGKLPRIDLWFELHADLGWPEMQTWAVPYLEWLNKQEFPVFAQGSDFIPRAMTFPYEELIAKFGCYFFTSTFAWMIAYAITQGAKEIGIFGIDMATDAEYARQRPGFQHFLQLAAQAGIKIMAPNESDILQPPPLYGYDMATAIGRKLAVRELELRGKISAFEQERGLLDFHITHLKGCLDDLDYVRSIWTGYQDHAEDARHLERIAVSKRETAPSPSREGVKGNGRDLHPSSTHDHVFLEG